MGIGFSLEVSGCGFQCSVFGLGVVVYRLEVLGYRVWDFMVFSNIRQLEGFGRLRA